MSQRSRVDVGLGRNSAVALGGGFAGSNRTVNSTFHDYVVNQGMDAAQISEMNLRADSILKDLAVELKKLRETRGF